MSGEAFRSCTVCRPMPITLASTAATNTLDSASAPLCTTKQLLPGVFIPDNSPRFDVNAFPTPLQYKGLLDSVLLPNGLIKDRVQQLVQQLASDHHGQEVHFLCVLKGAAVFFGDMLNHWMHLQHVSHLPMQYDYIRVKSYEGDSSTGRVQISGMDKLDRLQGKHVVIVEDIIDTGLTMERLVQHLRAEADPASIRVVSLLEKRTGRPSKYRADYVGFSVPDVFLCGYGMDFNEAYRDMLHLAIINKAGFEKFKNDE